MAKLKIFENNDFTQKKPSKEGYINVVNNYVLSPTVFHEFNMLANKSTRPTKLTQFAGLDKNSVQLKVFHEPAGGGSEEINNANCVIAVHKNKQKVSVAGLHNMTVPKDPLPNVSYLDVYVNAIVELHGDGIVNGETGMQRACKFLFGIMLLTRCR